LRAPTRNASYFGVTLFFWYFFNAVFAIFNKKTLNVFPYPWLLSWIQVRDTLGRRQSVG
jgi:solute carrier family 35 protein E1